MHQDVIVISGDKELEIGTVTIDLASDRAFSESIRCYANIIRNKDGGTHMSGLRTALQVALIHMRRKRIAKEIVYQAMMSERVLQLLSA